MRRHPAIDHGADRELGDLEGATFTRRPAGAPSLITVMTARTYNRAHAQYVAVFNTATSGGCLGADGELDPVAVWHWQKDHGLRRDGRVGPETAAAARSAAQSQPAEVVVAADHREPGARPGRAS